MTKHNIGAFNTPRCSCNLKTMRMNDDKKIFLNLNHNGLNANPSNHDIGNIIRLDAKQLYSHPLPMLVSFVYQEKRHLMKNAHKQ